MYNKSGPNGPLYYYNNQSNVTQIFIPLQFDIDTPFALKEFISQLSDAVGETLIEYSPGEPNVAPFLLKPRY